MRGKVHASHCLVPIIVVCQRFRPISSPVSFFGGRTIIQHNRIPGGGPCVSKQC